ncbi:NAD(P)/FAD-dependent oxidoreductase [Candidatus Oscillochloris fontis]|uniref:NAD(P)/FAD-dependent oxidoreductase n=1 Tax=Candidatus Oscillochloris fontis TaxID=2496868 RepID=UPI00101C28C4|nr:FAD-dependent oxidoreductase [Candidatus Oscillochloris fontis]
MSHHFDVIIIGAGPAGLAAAIYTARAGVSTLVIDQSSAGGQVKTTHQVANYPGFIEPVLGHQLAANMKKQAERYGTRFELAADITEMDLTGDAKWLKVDGETYTSKAVIIATGSSPRLLNVPGEQELKGSGISYCATCDGEFYTGKDIVVVGGGNSAMEESLMLLQHVNSITVIHQFDTLQAEKITADKVMQHPKVSFLWSHEPRGFEKQGERMVIKAENLKTQEIVTLERDGVFIFAGMLPNVAILRNTGLQMNAYGYITTNESMATNLPGVYAAGDVRDKRYRQITTSVGDGTIAALEVIRSV